MENNLFILHKHSLKYIAYSFAAFLLFIFLDLEFFALIAFVFMLFSAYIFRNPEKSLSSHEKNALVSPVDGTVLTVQELEDDSYGYKVEIESGYFDLSILRVPFNATVLEMSLFHGARVSKESKLFKELNENATLELADKDGNKIKIMHRLGKSFVPLYIDAYQGEELHKSARYGVLLSGITTVYLPKSFELNIDAGNQLSASETLLGNFL